MSQWEKIQSNPNIFKEMQAYYPPHFSMEVRYFLNQWIEEQDWNSIDENNIQDSPKAEELVDRMLVLLRHKAVELVDKEFFIIKVKLEESCQKIERTKSLEMVQTIKNCLTREHQLIQQIEDTPMQIQKDIEQQQAREKIDTEVQNLYQNTKYTEEKLKNLQHKQESFIIQFSNSQRIVAQRQQLANTLPINSPEFQQKENQLRAQKDKIDIELGQLANELLFLRIELANMYGNTIEELKNLQRDILETELISWKRRQQLAGNGLVITNSSLDTLQKWCEDLADLIWQNRQQIKKSTQLQQQLPMKYPDGSDDMLPSLNETITSLLSSLVTSTFIVEQQPPQVLKKDARFSASVSLLVGGKLNVHMNPPQVKTSIISEQQARELLKPNTELKAKGCSSGDILNNTGTMEYQASNGHLGIVFRNMQLKKIKRADKRGSEAVTEEKFCLLFQSEFSIGINELVFQVWTLSLPVVVTVHGNQECNALATILWDNAFAAPGRNPFIVPDHVDWSQLADQLSMKIMSLTGRGLNEDNLSYLLSKLFEDSRDPPSNKITWERFNKMPLAKRSFTFWEWCHGIIKLIKEHLKDLWNDDAIIGFISKNQAHDLLTGRPPGTFLLRFSDSEIGGVTIAFTGADKGVLNLAPFGTKDFHIRGLADRIRDLDNLVTLFPNRPKDCVFSKYYTSTSDNVMNNDGYIRPTLRTALPNEYRLTNETEFKQPYSQESFYESSINSVQHLDDLPTTPVDCLADDMRDMDMEMLLTDYVPDNIDEINDIQVLQLVNNYQI